MSIVNQRNKIATALKKVSGLHVYEYVPDSVTTPAAFVSLDNGDYYRTFQRQSGNRVYEIVVLVSRRPVVASQKLLDELLEPEGAMSIPKHLDDGTDMGDDGKILSIGPFTEYGGRIFNGKPYLGALFHIEVLHDI